MTRNRTSLQKIIATGHKAAMLFLLLLLALNQCNLNIIGYNQHYFKGMNIFFQKSTRNVYRPDEFRDELRKMNSLGINTLFLIPIHYCHDQFSDTIKATVETIEDSVLESIIISSSNKDLMSYQTYIDQENGTPRYQLSPPTFRTGLKLP
jgi:hypothetical protein